ncbi:MAG: DUF1186 domain-containing protein [Hyphomicrobiaceae bacterium]
MGRAEDGRKALLDMLGEAGRAPVDDIIAELTYCKIGERPIVPLAIVAARPEAFTDRLLAELDLSPEDVEQRISSAPDAHHAYFLHTFALYFLALWEEPRAFPLITAYLARDPELAAAQLDDMATDHLPAILARTFGGGDFSPVQALARQASGDFHLRAAALRGMHGAVLMGKLPRSVMETALQEAFESCMSSHDAGFGTELAIAMAETQAPAMRTAIKRLRDAGLVVEDVIGPQDVDAIFAARPDEISELLLRREDFDSLLDIIFDWSWFHITDPSELDTFQD